MDVGSMPSPGSSLRPSDTFSTSGEMLSSTASFQPATSAFSNGQAGMDAVERKQNRGYGEDFFSAADEARRPFGDPTGDAESVVVMLPSRSMQ